MADSAEARFAKLAAWAHAVTPVLDQSSYYELLGVPPTADIPAVKAAFYRLAGDLHPDRYHSLGDAATRDELAIIYARISEGYRVLSSPERRAAYDKGLADGNMRYASSDREKRGPVAPEETLKHHEAKKFFRLAMMAMARKDWQGAVMNLRFAKNFEPDAEAIAEQLAAAEIALKGFGK